MPTGCRNIPEHLPPMPGRRVMVVYFVLLWLCLSWAHQSTSGANQASRLDLLHSLTAQHTFAIDSYHQNTPDKARVGSHYFSDKAPGTVAIGLPAFLVTTVILEILRVTPDSETGWFESSWMTCAGSIATLAALGGTALFSLLCRWLSPRVALLSSLAIFLGSAPLPYSTMLFSHGASVGLITVALFLLDVTPAGLMGTGCQPVIAGLACTRAAAAGLMCGMAISCEYTAGLVVIGIMTLLRSLRVAVYFALGSTPSLLLIPAYHIACFGTPFTLAYSHEAVITKMRQGFYGIGWPNIQNAAYLLAGSEQGLFLWTPFLLLAFAGYPTLHQMCPKLFWVSYLVPLVQVTVISGYYDISAGW